MVSALIDLLLTVFYGFTYTLFCLYYLISLYLQFSWDFLSFYLYILWLRVHGVDYKQRGSKILAQEKNHRKPKAFKF